MFFMGGIEMKMENDMKAFLEKTIRQKISINKNEKVFNKLHLFIVVVTRYTM